MDEGMEVVGVLLPLFTLLLAAGGVAYVGAILLQAFRVKLLGHPGPTNEEWEELRERVADLEELPAGGTVQAEGRLLELEERVDFAERMLAREREPAALPESVDTTSTDAT
jgi:hypothetical protein